MRLAFSLAAALLLVSFGGGVAMARQSETAARDRAPHRTHWLDVGGARLEYLDFGGPARAPLLVLLPGFGDNAHAYDDIAPVLARDFRVVGLTPRGHGASSTPDTGYTVGTFAEDVRALLDTMGARRAFLIGHSIAGATITRFAARHPERTSGVVYLDATMDLAGRDSVLAANPVPRPAPTDSSVEGVRRWYRDYFYGFWTDAIANALRQGGTDENARARPRLLPGLMADATAHPKEYRAVRAPVLAIVAAKTVDANYPWLRGMGDAAQRAAASRYLEGTLNPWYAAGAARLRRERPDARVVTIRGHHYVHVTAQRDVAREITSFVRAVGR